MAELTIQVKASSSTTYTIKVPADATVQNAKEAIQSQSNTPAANIRLIYSGQVLANEKTLDSYGVKDGHTMHMVAKASAAQPQAAPSANIAPGSPPVQPAAAGANVNNQALPNPFAAMFGGMGAPGMAGAMGGPMGGMGMGMDPNALAQMMGNPMIQQQVQQMMANPQVLQQMLGNNPMAQQLLANNPQMMQMFQDPEFLRQMTDPRMLQMAMQMQNDPAMQQMMQGMGVGGLGGVMGAQQPAAQPAGNAGVAPGGSTAGAAPGNAAGAAPSMMNFANLFGGFAPPMPAAAAPVQNPEERFTVQLQQLQDMGFNNRAVNIRVLQQVNGNVEAAVERLLMG
jgi:ubiquilin